MATRNVVEEPINSRDSAPTQKPALSGNAARSVVEEAIQQPSQASTTSSIAPSDTGFAQGVKRGVLNIGRFAHQFGSDLASPKPVILSDDKGSVADRMQGDTMLNRYVLAPAAAEKQRSLEEAQAFRNTSGLPAVGHGLNTMIHTAGEMIPVLGPMVGSLVDRAEAGDISGAVGEGATYGLAPRVMRGVGGRLIEGARDLPGVRTMIPSTEGVGRAVGRNIPASIARPLLQSGLRGVSAPSDAGPYANVDFLRSKMAARPVEPAGPYPPSALTSLMRMRAPMQFGLVLLMLPTGNQRR